jgi:type IV pilus assembly protein PilM
MKFSDLLSAFGASRDTAPRTVGIDIGSSAIKVVELEEREGVLTLTTYGEIQLGPYNALEVGESVLLPADKEQQALVDVLRESAVKAKKSVLAMPLSASFVTVMSLKSEPEEDLTPRIRVEARKYIPTQISEVTLDWAEIARGEASEGDRDVLVAAIQNDALKRFNDLTEFVGFPKPPSEIECFSAIRAIGNGEEVPAAIIDIGAVSSKLYIVHAGILQRMHRVRAGGALATKRIAESLELGFSDAEYQKRHLSEAVKQRDAIRAHASSYDRALVEFRQVIENYEQSLGVTLSTVTLTGGGALFEDIKRQAKDVLAKEVMVAQPFSKVAYPAFMEDLLMSIGPTFTVALGAALRAYE